MGAVRSQLVINDGMTSALRRINKAMSLMIGNFEAVQRASGQSINTANLNAARQEIGRANAQLDVMEQNYRAINDQQNNLNRGLNTGTKNAGGLLSKIKSVAAAYLGMKGVTATVDLSDTLTSSRARLDLIVDDGGSVSELEQKIYASAQRSRSYYVDTMATVSKLGLVAGKAFSGNDEIIAFQELVNKNFVVGGASATEQASAMYQLTQAMGSGRLQGDEYRSIIENAPLLAKSIEDYMRNVQGATGTMKDWASEGKLTADVIKAAAFNSADEVEERFNQMPKTWSQVWTSMKNRAIKALDPVLVKINQLANEPKVQNAINGVMNGFTVLANVAAEVFKIVCDIFNFMADNWSWIRYIIMGIVGALLIYKGALFITSAVEAIVTVGKLLFASATGAQATQTTLAAAAQHGLNGALMACPITWIIALVLLFIVVLLLLWEKCSWFREFWAKMWRENMDIVLWAYNDVIVPVSNWFMRTQSKVAVAVSNFAKWCVNAYYDMLTSISDAVASLMNKMTGLVNFYNKIASAMGGVTISIDAVDNFSNQLESNRQKYLEIIDAYGKKYGTATQIGKINEDKFNAVADEWQNEIENFTISGWIKDKWSEIEGGLSGLNDSFQQTYNSTLDDIANDTSSIAGSSDKTTEELAYMRDIAEQEAINRFTTAEVKIDMTGMTNRIDSNMDIDGVVGQLTDGFVDALSTAAEGVHDDEL